MNQYVKTISKDQLASWIPNNCIDQKFILSENMVNHDQKIYILSVCHMFFQDFTTVLDFIS